MTQEEIDNLPDNRSKILAEFENDKGQFVIGDHDWKVQRLIGVGEDDMDFYWIFWDGRKSIWATCVCGYTKLKGKIEDKDYNSYVRLSKLNDLDSPTIFGSEPTPERLLDIDEGKRKIERSLSKNHTLLVPLCWEIN